MKKNNSFQILRIITDKTFAILFLFVNGIFESVHFSGTSLSHRICELLSVKMDQTRTDIQNGYYQKNVTFCFFNPMMFPRLSRLFPQNRTIIHL